MQSRLPLAEAMLAAKEGQFEFASCEKNVVGDAEQQIEDLIERLQQEGLSVYQQDEFMDIGKSLVKNQSSLNDREKSRLADVLSGELRNQTKGIGRVLEAKLSPEVMDLHKCAMESVMLLIFAFYLNEERSATDEKSTKTESKKKSKKPVNDVWNWEENKLEFLFISRELLGLNLSKIWALLNEREPFLNLFIEMINASFESENNVKSVAFREAVNHILATLVAKYSQESAIKTMVLQNLRYTTFLSELMADLVSMIYSEYNCVSFVNAVLQDIREMEFQADDKQAKEFSKFLVNLSAQSSKAFTQSLSFIQEQLDSDSYTIRCALIEAIGNLMIWLASFEMDQKSVAQATNLCLLLEERLYDVSSYCRARSLKTFSAICEAPINGSASTKNAIPLDRRYAVVQASIGRLEDKASIVRKDACRLLIKLIETHPFWLDGGVLDKVLFSKKKEAVILKLENLEKVLRERLSNEKMQIEKELCTENYINNHEDQEKILSANSLEAFGEEEKELMEKELEHFLKSKRYYEDAIKFVAQMEEASEKIYSMLFSSSKSDVLEAIDFFVEAKRHSLPRSDEGMRKLLHLIWTKDSSDIESRGVREHVISAYQQLYIDNVSSTEKDHHKKVAKNLIGLTFGSSLADMVSLERLLYGIMQRELITEDTINHLWHIFGNTSADSLPEIQRGALAIIGLLGSFDSKMIAERMDNIAKVGLSTEPKPDFLMARYSCFCLRKLSPSSLKKEVDFQRFPSTSYVFRKIIKLLHYGTLSVDWFCFAEEAIATFYELADRPDILALKFLETLALSAFSQNELKITCFNLCKFLYSFGHVVMKHLVHLERVEAHLKFIEERKAPNSKQSKNSKNDEMENVVGSVEDHIGDSMKYIREEELLYDQKSFICQFRDLVVSVCKNEALMQNIILQRIACVTLVKLMLVSERFCEEQLGLLLALLKFSKDATNRGNLVVGLGDLAISFSNLLDQNISHLYDCLSDSSSLVKRNALMVLTHLILNGMIKVRGQIASIACCVQDADPEIQDIARLFFMELATKDNALYNNMPDVISALSSGQFKISESQFREIMRFLFSFVEKDKYSESLVDKLCQRLKNSFDCRLWRDISYCLSSLPYASDKSVKKLLEHEQLFQDKVHDDFVFKCFCDIIGKARKAARLETRQALDDFEAKINAWHRGMSASQPTTEQQLLSEAAMNMEGFQICDEDHENQDPNIQRNPVRAKSVKVTRTRGATGTRTRTLR